MSRDRKHVVSAPPASTQNHLLAALPREDYERLLPHLELVPLPLDGTVYGPGERQKYLYFPIAGIATKYCMTASGASTECAVTGSEGVIGISMFLGGESTPCEMQMLIAGYAYRLRADLLKHELDHNDSLLHLLLRYTQALLTQTAQIAVCNRHHSVEQQLCRWILSFLDRLPSNELVITQEQIADMLGVRRESVTEAAGALQRAGLIHYSRGHIVVLHRLGLEAQVCECYAVVKREYNRLIPKYRQMVAPASI
ncbi:MAG: Crp/Fnr family transcriptional regulator [Sulfuricaulis sp.]